MAIQRKRKTILKQGSFAEVTAEQNVPGINLQKLVVDKLAEESCLITTNNHDYYPTFPEISAANHTAPTEEEMVDVPIKGVFIAAQTASTYSVRIKTSASTSASIVAIT